MRDAAQANRRPAAMLLQPPLVIATQRSDLIGGIAVGIGRFFTRRTRLQKLGRRFSILRELGQDGRLAVLEQVQRRRDDLMLKFRVISFAQGIAEGEGDEERAGRLDPLGVLLDECQGNSCQAALFQGAGEHTDRVRAVRSGGCEEDDLDPFAPQELRHLRPGLVRDTPWVPLSAHKRVVVG